MSQDQILFQTISNSLTNYISIYQKCDLFVDKIRKITPYIETIISERFKQTNLNIYNSISYSLFESSKDIKTMLISLETLQKQFATYEESLNLSLQFRNLVANSLVLNPNNIIHWLSQIQAVIDSGRSEYIGAEKEALLTNIQHYSNDFKNLHQSTQLKLAQLNNFKLIGQIKGNIILIGANGSGKSTFSRSIKAVLGQDVTIIAAQKIFQFSPITSLPLNDDIYQKVRQYQSSDKLGRQNNANELSSDLQNLILALIREHQNNADKFYTESKSGNAIRINSKLERVIKIWGEIITHRNLYYDKGKILVKYKDGNDYDFSQLSDGEKAIFYYIAHILQAQEECYIIIDEPENHLHFNVVKQLWDKLENERKDCSFVYLTHNVDFASSREPATILWNKKFSPPSKWDVEKIPTDTELPETLLLELLGTRQNTIFCEGEKSSLDYKLLQTLFPTYSIQPVGGHIQVINYTRTYNKSNSFKGKKAIGIIDGDYHSTNQVARWNKDDIFCIPVQEVENLLCDDSLLEAAAKKFCAPKGTVEEAKKELLKKLDADIETQIIKYITQRINETFKGNMLKESKSLSDLEDSIDSISTELKVNEWYQERKDLLLNIIANNDYEKALKHYNYKGIIGFVPIKILKEYKDRIIPLLREDENLRVLLIGKYFNKIEIEN